MEKLLKDHALVFLRWRTAKSLIEHWLHLRDYHLLSDQNGKILFETAQNLNLVKMLVKNDKIVKRIE